MKKEDEKMKSLPLHNPDFESLYKEFDNFIVHTGYSRGKQSCYASQVREFLFFIENRGVDTIKGVIALDVMQYYEYLRERPNQRRGGGLSESMIRSHLFSLRLFFDYLMDVGEINASPAHLPKFDIGEDGKRQALTIDEIKEVDRACITKMERALIAIGYGCGLRRTEMELLDTNDVDFSRGILIVRDGKGGKSRTIPLSDNGIKTLKEYVIEERPTLFLNEEIESTPAFFIKSGKRMKGGHLNDLLKVIILRTQNPNILDKDITLHCLRHSIATHLLDNGAEFDFVQEFLGHELPDTTTIYAKHRKQRFNLYKQINAPVYGSN